MARAAAIDEDAWIGSAAAPLRALVASRIASSPRVASVPLSSLPSRSRLAISALASLVVHAGILLAIALGPRPAQPTGEPNAVAVEFVVADAAATRPASAPSTPEPSHELAAAQASSPVAPQSQDPPAQQDARTSQDAPTLHDARSPHEASPSPAPASETAAPVAVASPPSSDAPAPVAASGKPVALPPALAATTEEPLAIAAPPEEAKPGAAPAVISSEAPEFIPPVAPNTPVAAPATVVAPPALAAKAEPVAIAPPPQDEVKPIAAPAIEDAATSALAGTYQPVAIAPAPMPAASKVAPTAPRPVAQAAAPAAQPPAKPAKSLAPAEQPKVAPKPAAKVAAAKAKPLPRAAAAASAGSAPTRGIVDLAAYRNALLAKISGAVRYPEEARARGVSGVAAVNFALDAAGDVTLAQLTRSSGDGELDAEAIAAVRRASPLPAPPADAPRAYVAPIRFELH